MILKIDKKKYFKLISKLLVLLLILLLINTAIIWILFMGSSNKQLIFLIVSICLLILKVWPLLELYHLIRIRKHASSLISFENEKLIDYSRFYNFGIPIDINSIKAIYNLPNSFNVNINSILIGEAPKSLFTVKGNLQTKEFSFKDHLVDSTEFTKLLEEIKLNTRL